MRIIIIGLLTIISTSNSWSQTKSDNSMQTLENTFPFKITDNDGQYSIVAEIESSELFNMYNPVFDKYEYSGNGYSWEGHITQILEKVDKELLKHIDFDPEAGAFYAYADSKDAQLKFVNVLSPIFSDLKKLENYLKSADRSRIDD